MNITKKISRLLDEGNINNSMDSRGIYQDATVTA